MRPSSVVSWAAYRPVGQSPVWTAIVTGADRLPVQSSGTGSPFGTPTISSFRSLLTYSAPQWRNCKLSAPASARIRSSIGSPGRYDRCRNAASTPSTRTTGAACLAIEGGRLPPRTVVPRSLAGDRQSHHVGAHRRREVGRPGQRVRSRREVRLGLPGDARRAPCRVDRLELHRRGAVEREADDGSVASRDAGCHRCEQAPVSRISATDVPGRESECRVRLPASGERRSRREHKREEYASGGAQKTGAADIARHAETVDDGDDADVRRSYVLRGRQVARSDPELGPDDDRPLPGLRRPDLCQEFVVVEHGELERVPPVPDRARAAEELGLGRG